MANDGLDGLSALESAALLLGQTLGFAMVDQLHRCNLVDSPHHDSPDPRRRPEILLQCRGLLQLGSSQGMAVIGVAGEAASTDDEAPGVCCGQTDSGPEDIHPAKQAEYKRAALPPYDLMPRSHLLSGRRPYKRSHINDPRTK